MNKVKAVCGHSDCTQDQKQVIIFSPRSVKNYIQLEKLYFYLCV